MEPIYNAGFMGDRAVTLPMDDFDAVVNVGLIAGSFVELSPHDASKPVVPELSCRSLVFAAAMSLALVLPRLGSHVIVRRTTTFSPH
jgi:hypothetical protein